MTSATERLRALLDERGVKWETDRSGFRVMWGKPVDEFHDTMQFKAVDNALPNGGLNVHICGFTPEQAIAATLGPGTCKRVFYEPTGVYVCSECGCGLSKKLDKYCYLHYCPNCGAKVVE